MAKTTPLEAQLTAVTQEFVGRIVGILRSSSFDEVVQLASASNSPFAASSGVAPRPSGARPAPNAGPRPRTSPPPQVAPPARAGGSRGGSRQTADVRQLIANRIVTALETAGTPQSARAISSSLGVPVDLLTVPLKELRDAGRVHKHGEKRATTYSVG
ncbi:MAG: hypothetical protein EOO75_19910 [Myxococcales bacterium]|nr:MAG: hypothetical protein EOO75_19910 [Myxococcales bacterium]